MSPGGSMTMLSARLQDRAYLLERITHVLLFVFVIFSDTAARELCPGIACRDYHRCHTCEEPQRIPQCFCSVSVFPRGQRSGHGRACHGPDQGAHCYGYRYGALWAIAGCLV